MSGWVTSNAMTLLFRAEMRPPRVGWSAGQVPRFGVAGTTAATAWSCGAVERDSMDESCLVVSKLSWATPSIGRCGVYSCVDAVLMRFLCCGLTLAWRARLASRCLLGRRHEQFLITKSTPGSATSLSGYCMSGELRTVEV